MSIPISILIFIAILLVVIITHELGHFFAAKAAGVKVLEFAIGFPPRLFGIKRGETQYSVNLIPLGAFVRTAGENDPTVPGSLASKSPWVRMGVYLSGPLANGLLAFILFATFLMIPAQVVVGSYKGAEVGNVISELDGVTEELPAYKAGIKKGDIILQIDNTVINYPDDMHRAIEGKAGKIVTLLLQRNGDDISIDIIPIIDPNTGNEIIGIGYTWSRPYITDSERYSFWDAAYYSGKTIADTPWLFKDALIQNPGDAIAGPVGTGQVAVEVLKYGVSNIIFLAAIISLGIGVFNIFPIPPLDGGGIVIAAIEGVRRGKRLSPRAMQLVYMIGTALLITFFILITYNDVLRLTTD